MTCSALRVTGLTYGEIMRRVLAVLLAMAAVLTPGAAAQADTGDVTRHPLTTSFKFTEADKDKVVIERPLTLAAGERRHLRGRLEAVSSTDKIVAMNAVLKCFTTTSPSVLVGTAATTTQNHRGKSADYPVTGHLVLFVDLLLHVDSPGTYECGLYAKTSAGQSVGTYNLAAVTGGKTWLEISDSHQPAAQWWENPVCNSDGTSPTCTYIGKGQPDDAFVFYNDGTPQIKWAPIDGVRYVDALANVTVTTCYVKTGSCDPDRVPNSDRKDRDPGTASVVAFQLQVIQLDRDNSHACLTKSSAVQTIKVLDDAHHYTAYLSVPEVKVEASCGGRFLLRVHVEHISGSPVKIDGQQGDTSLTSGIMMNSKKV